VLYTIIYQLDDLALSTSDRFFTAEDLAWPPIFSSILGRRQKSAPASLKARSVVAAF